LFVISGLKHFHILRSNPQLYAVFLVYTIENLISGLVENLDETET